MGNVLEHGTIMCCLYFRCICHVYGWMWILSM